MRSSLQSIRKISLHGIALDTDEGDFIGAMRLGNAVYFSPNDPEPGYHDTMVERKGPDLSAMEMTVHDFQKVVRQQDTSASQKRTLLMTGAWSQGQPRVAKDIQEQPRAGCLSKHSKLLLTDRSFL